MTAAANRGTVVASTYDVGGWSEDDDDDEDRRLQCDAAERPLNAREVCVCVRTAHV